MQTAEAALAGTKSAVFWLDDAARPAAAASLSGPESADLVVVGGGFSGLWTALLAKERNPDRDVVLLEGDRIAAAATGRNGGFCEYSLTHGYSNGLARFPGELDTLERLGLENFDQIAETIARYGIDCSFAQVGSISVAVEPWQAEELRELVGDHADDANGQSWIDQESLQSQIASPTYLGGISHTRGAATVNPARLAWGLADVCRSLGVRIYEGTQVEGIRRTEAGLQLSTPGGTVLAQNVALGTNVFPSLIRRARMYTVPVYDYVLVTEPLSAEQLDSIGWDGRQGLSDSGNHFHYYRLTDDNRILWGGWDAVYHFGKRVSPKYDDRDETYRTLARQFFETFPQLEGLGFTHKWGGAIDTCSRFCAFFSTAYGARVAHAAGYTGLGVAATRFGANVMLDLLDGETTERTELDFVKSKPIPFPPEPLSWIGVEATRWSLSRADSNEGRRNLWLRTLDRLGMGFDS